MKLARLNLKTVLTQFVLGRAEAANIHVPTSTEPAKKAAAFNRTFDTMLSFT